MTETYGPCKACGTYHEPWRNIDCILKKPEARWNRTKFEFLEDGGVVIIKRWTALNLEPIEDIVRLTGEELIDLFNQYRDSFLKR